MRRTKAILAVVALTVLLGLTSTAIAQGVQFVGVGSSAMFTATAVGAFTDLCSSRTGSDCRHYSISGKNTGDGQNYAQAFDSRNSGIPVEGGTLWVVWDNNTSPISVWAYLSVDSVVGNRCFFAKLAFRRLQFVFPFGYDSLRDRPSSDILLSPKWPAGMHKKNLKSTPGFPVHQEPSTRLRHSRICITGCANPDLTALLVNGVFISSSHPHGLRKS